MKYDNEIRAGAHVAEIVGRAAQMARSDPKGPAYLVAAREVLEAEAPQRPSVHGPWPPLEPTALPDSGARAIAQALARAERPLIVTSYVGREPRAVDELVRLCRRHGIGVLESVPSYMNYPHTDSCYMGGQWNEQAQNPVLADADVVLVVDSDVPWIPVVNRPAHTAVLFHIDVDPLKERTPLWHIDARATFRADAATALRQIYDCFAGERIDEAAVAARLDRLASAHDARAAMLRAREDTPRDQRVTAPYLMACLRRLIDDNTIVVNEGITNYPVVFDHLARSRPGSIFASGGGSLGWSGGAALGMKLACPDRTVVTVTGDGSYMFSIPSSVFWMSKRYEAPFLQIILNNGGWRAPRFSALNLHPTGFASRASSLDLSFDPSPDYAGIAAAAGEAAAFRINRGDEVESALRSAWDTVRHGGRAAVVDVRVAAT